MKLQPKLTMPHQILSTIQIEAKQCRIECPDYSMSIMEDYFDKQARCTTSYLVSLTQADRNRIFLHIQKCLTPRALQPFPLLLRFRARPTFNRASPLAIASSEASVREIRLLRRGLSAADRPRSRLACL